MKVLVIPDVHLKPWMFDKASELMSRKIADQAVCLMDIADDFKKQYMLGLYRETYDAAIRFTQDFPETRWCYGNHDVSYVWQMKETGYSPVAPKLVCEKLRELKEALPDPGQLAFVHRIDDCIFSHTGISAAYIRRYFPFLVDYDNADKVIAQINASGCGKLWVSDEPSSPLWFRPQWQCTRDDMYLPDQYLQIVGHTPVKEITQTFDCLMFFITPAKVKTSGNSSLKLSFANSSLAEYNITLRSWFVYCLGNKILIFFNFYLLLHMLPFVRIPESLHSLQNQYRLHDRPENLPDQMIL